MAAIDLSSVNVYPHTHRVTLSGTPDTMQAFTIGAACTQVQVISEANSCKIVTQGGADATVITTEHYLEVPAGSLYYHDLPRSKGTHTLWIASGTASTVVSVQVGARD